MNIIAVCVQRHPVDAEPHNIPSAKQSNWQRCAILVAVLCLLKEGDFEYI